MSLDTNHLTPTQEKLIHSVLNYPGELTENQATAIANILQHQHYVVVTAHVENNTPKFEALTDDIFSSVQLCKAGVELFWLNITAESNQINEADK